MSKDTERKDPGRKPIDLGVEPPPVPETTEMGSSDDRKSSDCLKSPSATETKGAVCPDP